MGLACGHAFSLLRAIEVAGERLVQIRNPWGNATEWKGAWCDTDPRWKSTPVVAKACTFSPAPDDGTFWMSWKDAMRFAEYRVVQCSTGDYETVSATGAFVATPAVAMTCRLKVCAKDVQSRTAAPYLIFPASALI